MNQDLSLNVICAQRSQRRANKVPPIRLTLTSPYPQFTQNQIDMRRKAEILKYDNSNQNKRLTKNEKWRQAVNKNTRNQMYSALVNYDASGNYTVTRKYSRVCPDDRFISTPTYACDVPGPIMNLTYNSDVPLYNYATYNRSYSIINTNLSLSNNSTVENDTAFPDGRENLLTALYLGTNITRYTNVYNFTIPIGMYFVATQLYPAALNRPLSFLNNSLNITSVKINVYYGDSLVNPKTTPRVYLSNSGTKYDFVTNNPPPINFNINFTPIKKEDSVNFSLFSGTLHIENLELITSPGFVYNIKAVFSLTSSISNIIFNSTFAYYSYGVTSNLSLKNASVTQNCSINPPDNYPIPAIYPISTIS